MTPEQLRTVTLITARDESMATLTAVAALRGCGLSAILIGTMKRVHDRGQCRSVYEVLTATHALRVIVNHQEAKGAVPSMPLHELSPRAMETSEEVGHAFANALQVESRAGWQIRNVGIYQLE
ncbi:MAG TPA: hypothetical protein VL614_25120 [Acetobacteraceae bacterium]|nr:hypothetical protein [Acetobacteraceae bacterium]